ncbi:hypothetical protein [Clostridium sp. AF32-12BH]|uniref:hypothetical protein n=1 Tax=Clostridium sp. AF32-12BH TaxID=2292006 RepID=UPI000E54D119|nr:hypothetical protein [Clostridium sp. AF32-12BH]RHP47027.1 hypothetical protein DWZ40_08975 [Clostridium sp. AF32-12BH]
MLKTNSKKVHENVKKYILANFDPCNSEEFAALENTNDIKAACNAIYNTFKAEKAPVGAYATMTERERFIDWCSGLPSILDTCYYYNRSAIDDLAKILEETEEESKGYGESQAEDLISYLLYHEIKKNL